MRLKQVLVIGAVIAAVAGFATGLQWLIYVSTAFAAPVMAMHLFSLMSEERAKRKQSGQGRIRRTLGVVGSIVVPRLGRKVVVDGADRTGMDFQESGRRLAELTEVCSQAKRPTYRNEDFATAMQRFGLTEADIDRIGRQLQFRGRIFVGGAFVFVAVLVGALFSLEWAWAISAAIAAEVALLLAAVALFRAMQCNRRQFFRFLDYLRQEFWRDVNPIGW